MLLIRMVRRVARAVTGVVIGRPALLGAACLVLVIAGTAALLGPLWAAQGLIRTITPSAAYVGDQVTITGHGFGAHNVRITVGGIAAPVLSATGHSATFLVPTGVPPGPTTVTATNPGGRSGSIAFTVLNHPPVANAGPDQTVFVTDTVQLDGSASSDADGDPLTFQWTILSGPAGSTATLSDPTAVRPTFIVDRPGTYIVQLLVDDGRIDSAPDTVQISTINSRPVADADPDQTVHIGGLVQLDGSASSDVDGDPLTYGWAFVSTPTDSQAALLDATMVHPSFVADLPGRYELQLIVNDGTLDSKPDTVQVDTINSAPVADAGPDQQAAVSDTVQLDGSSSSDIDGDPLTYRWSLTTAPTDSAASLLDPTTSQPTFVPDLPGDYIAQLIVNDGFEDSLPDTVAITVQPPANRSPVAHDDTAITDANASVGITVLGNDSDSDGDPLTITGVTQGTNSGTIAINGVTVTYTPPPNWSGADTFTYVISDGRGGTATATVRVTVNSVNRPPSVTLEADQTGGPLPLAVVFTATATDPDGDPLTYAWDFGDGKAKSSASAGESHTYQAAGTFTAMVTVSDGTLTAQASLTITPSGIPDPSTVAPPLSQTATTDLGSGTAFLYSGSNPIQTGVAPGIITPTRAAVLRGRVFNNLGMPLPGVVVSVLNHPELGETQSRSDGWFDLAVNGGGLLTVQYENAGYLPAQRQAQAPWQDFVILPDVVMIPRDMQATTVDLTAPVSMQVAQGNPVTDADGTRQAALLIPQGTQAQVLLPDGGTQAVSTLTLRLTEYTVGPDGPRRMPAPLPPNSAYTYAVELGADEAIAKLGGKDVLFNQPVFFYVDNFLNFPVGIPVPTGYYDNSRGVWVPSDSGRIIKILSITGGLADLDTDGDGLADNGVALGIAEAERAQLASRYAAGTSLWRVPVSHLSTWDCNWGFGPPSDAQPSQGPVPQADPQPNEPNQCEGSIVGCQDQTLGEALPLAGTPFSLHYQSDRVPGRAAAYSVDISLSASSVPASLKRIELEVLVAGRLFTQTFPPTPNQRTTFTWDGLDAYGRRVQGQSLATVRIGYVYNGVYQQTSRFGYWGNGIPITGSRTRREVTLWRTDAVPIGPWDARGQGLGGWTLSAHHVYDPVGKLLYLGDGSRRSANDITRTITHVAGPGVSGSRGDGGPATQAWFHYPWSVAVASDGSFYIADALDNRVRRVGPDGIITTVAGGGVSGLGDGGPATQATLYWPYGVAVAPDGSLYIVDRNNHRVRRVGPDGIITTVAGTGVQGFSGDGGPATQAVLNYPYGVAVGPDGNLYIGDNGNSRVRRVGPDGIITTVAGSGAWWGLGDGGPATQATLHGASGVAVAPDGSLYIVESQENRVRRVGPDGIITTVAGAGSSGFRGDGGPAIMAQLYSPAGVAVAPDGSLYIADWYNNRVRRVGPDGIITTVAGTGIAGFSGDGGPATQAKLGYPSGVAVEPGGSLYIADWGNNRVRRVGSALPGFAAADIAIPSEDGRELYQFDRNGRHLRTLHALTAATLYTFTYDSDGRLTQVTDGNGNVTTIQRDGSGAPTAIVAPFGQQTTLALDSNGFLSNVTDPAGATTQLTSSSEGLLTTLTDPKGNLREFTYDSLGRLIKDQDPAAGFLALTRTEDLSTRTYSVAVTSALGRTSTFQVQQLSTGDERRVNTDPAGLQTTRLLKTDGTEQTTNPDGRITTRTDTGDPRWGMMAPVPKSFTVRAPSGLTLTSTSTRTATLSDSTNPLSLTAQHDTLVLNGRTATRHFDAATRTFTTTSPAGRVSTRTIDPQGRIVSTQLTGLAPLNMSYDPFGRLATITAGTGPDTRTTTLAYDSQSYVQSITDPLGRVTSFTYDAVGRPLTQTLPDSRVIQTTYDANGNVTALTPPSRPPHTFDYTPVDLEATYSPPDLGIGNVATTYTYNADRQLTQVTRPDGQTVDLNYDTGSRLSTLVTPIGTLQYTYSPTTGNLASITAPGSTLSYTYDGSLLKTTTWAGTVAGSVTRTYDTDFRLASQSVNGANPISFGYDADSLLTFAGALNIARSAQHGLITGTTLGSVSDTRSYNAFGELSTYTASHSGSPVFSTTYTRDKLGRIAQKVETISGSTDTFDYAYDPAGRLQEVTKNGTVISTYAYDANGNRLSLITPRGTVNGSVDAQDRLSQYGATAYTYTANGELQSTTTSGQTTTYQYDALGNLKGVVGPTGFTIEYVVDGQNRRIGKKVNETLAQGWLYQNQLNPVAELDGLGNVVSRFVYGTKANVPDYLIKGGVTYRIVSDHLGSPRLVINTADGSVAQQMDYDEFGNVLVDTNPGFQPFGFAGGLYDLDTSLVRFGARDYDASTGRWTTKDPIRFSGGDTNLYGYVLNDSINLVDPRGLDATITLYPGAWGFGHIGIGINSPYTVGFYPDPNASRSSIPTGLEVPGVIQPDARTEIQTITIPTTPAQDQAMQKFINRATQNPGNYDLYNRNCATFVQDVLDAGGTHCPATIFPRTLMKNLLRGECQ